MFLREKKNLKNSGGRETRRQPPMFALVSRSVTEVPKTSRLGPNISRKWFNILLYSESLDSDRCRSSLVVTPPSWLWQVFSFFFFLFSLVQRRWEIAWRSLIAQMPWESYKWNLNLTQIYIINKMLKHLRCIFVFQFKLYKADIQFFSVSCKSPKFIRIFHEDG